MLLQALNSHCLSVRRSQGESLACCNAGFARGGSCLSSWQPAASWPCRIAMAIASPNPGGRVRLGFGQPVAPPRHGHLQAYHGKKFELQQPASTMGSVLAREITKSIGECKRLQDLEDVIDEWGSSFDYIHTSAAFAKAAKLVQDGSARASGVVVKLVRIWKQQYSGSGLQGLTNVLWASSKLQLKDPGLWSGTLQAFLQDLDGASFRQLANVVYAIAVIASANKGVIPGLSEEQVQQSMTSIVEQAYILVTHPALEDPPLPQEIANILWSCGKLRFSIQGHELAAFVKAISRPDMVEGADDQALANSIYALGELHKVCDLHLAINQQLWGRVLHPTVVAKLANGSSQHVSNTLLALARLATGSEPVVSQSLAQGCALQLLNGSVAAHVGVWKPQELCNALYACAKLQLKHQSSLDAFVSAVPSFISNAGPRELKQIAWACASLSLPAHCLGNVVARNLQLVASSNIRTSDRLVTGMTAVVASSIAELDMQELAADVVGLICSPTIQRRLALRLSPADAGMLWRVHTWLVDIGLPHTHGLSQCMTPEQLAIGQEAYDGHLNRLAG